MGAAEALGGGGKGAGRNQALFGLQNRPATSGSLPALTLSIA